MATFSEFYCNASTGDNLNAGSTAGGAAVYTTNAGNWVQVSRVFTPTDGSTPASSIAVGDFVSVYLTAGATVAVFIGRVTVVAAGVNGAITVHATASWGSSPSNGTGTMTLKAGGTWKGPNGATAFPFNNSLQALQNAAGNVVRINMKNNASYAMTSAFAGTNMFNFILQGYSSTVGDGGKALLTSTFVGSGNFNFRTTGGQSVAFIDLIWECTGTSQTADLHRCESSGATYIRNVFRGGRKDGFTSNQPFLTMYECEFYDNNKSNTASSGGWVTASSVQTCLVDCYSHDNAGSNACGFLSTGGTIALFRCIADSNGSSGFAVGGSASGVSMCLFNCNAHNNGGDGFTNATPSLQGFSLLVNCNFTKNVGKAINVSGTAQAVGWSINNGYGAGTEANGSVDALANFMESAKITYPSNSSPFQAAATGNFTLVLAQAIHTGRQVFQENDGTNTGTLSYPDMGATTAAAVGAPAPNIGGVGGG